MLLNKKVCVIVGAGGIGSNLFQKLTRYAPLTFDILLIDGDVVENKNILRQMFTSEDVGKNKAECLTRKANNVLQERNYFCNEFISTNGFDGSNKLQELVHSYNEIILFGCLDNHPSRRQLENFFNETWKKVLYIDCANGEDDGDVVSVYKEIYQLNGTVRSMYDASVLIDNDNDPNKKSCTDELDEGNIQTLIANDKASIIALEIFHDYLNKEIKTGLWRFEKCVKTY